MKCLPCREQQVATSTAVSLCLAAATHSFILFSFFPYAGYMSVNLLNNNNNSNDSITVDNVGIYAGMLGAAFTFGRFLGFVPWKFVRDRLGGKHALILSLFLTGMASLWVGLATTFTSALAARFAQGISNCISGCVKRAAINARYNQALMLSIMWWGSALGPIVGGLLSDPRFLGSSLGLELDSEDGGWYASYPYLLPNIFNAFLCMLSMACVTMFTKDEQPHNK